MPFGEGVGGPPVLQVPFIVGDLLGFGKKSVPYSPPLTPAEQQTRADAWRINYGIGGGGLSGMLGGSVAMSATVPGTGQVAVRPPPVAAPGIDPTTDISAILKKLPVRLGPQLAEWISKYRYLISVATYVVLSGIIDEYNRAQALDEKAKADAIRKADREYAKARRQAIKDARAQARDAREQTTFEQQQLDRARAERDRLIKELERTGKLAVKAAKAGAAKGRQLEQELRELRKNIPTPPPFKSARVQTIERVLKGIIGYQQVRASLKKPSSAVSVNLSPGVPAPGVISGDLTGFETGMLGFAPLASDYAPTASSAEEVCSCRPRYPRRRRKKKGEKRICYTRKVSR